jgi:hypothetical protein
VLGLFRYRRNDGLKGIRVVDYPRPTLGSNKEFSSAVSDADFNSNQ